MGTLNEDLSAIKEVEDKIIANKVARFAYTDEAYTTNDANGVAEYDVSKEQNIPTADASVLKVNETVLSKGYRAQASSITRMLLNRFFGRMSYNLNKVNDIVSNLIATLIGHRGTANGFATLDENGRVPYSQLPESAMEYKGQWNAETNTPTLADGNGTKGDFYIVSVSGTQNLGSGNIQFFVNDRVIYDGSVWSRLSAGDVKTVNNISPENGNIALTGENIPVSATNATLLSAPLTTDRYADSSVTNAKIADNAVTNAKIADNAVTNAKIKEPISVAKGGTGATDAKDGFMNLANGLSEATGPLDEEYMIYKNIDGTNWGLYSLSTFWEHIKGKISSVLGLTTTQYNGNASTASSTNCWSAADTSFKGNVNDLEIGRWYSVNTSLDTVLNVPDKNNGWASILTFAANNNPIYKQQLGIYSNGNLMYTRTCVNNSWGNWERLAKASDVPLTNMVYACQTDSATAAKTVSIPGFTLTQGACIRVLFVNGNSAENPRLKVNSNDAIPIYTNKQGNLNFIVKDWDAGISMTLMFKGDSFVVLGNPIVKLELDLVTAGSGAVRNFIRYASGLLIQWGAVTVNGLTQQPIEAYTSASSYSLLATPSDGATGWIKCLRYDKKIIKLAIEVTSGGYTDGTVSWLTIGW